MAVKWCESGLRNTHCLTVRASEARPLTRRADPHGYHLKPIQRITTRITYAYGKVITNARAPLEVLTTPG